MLPDNSFLIKNRRIMAPVLSILIAVLIVYLSFYISEIIVFVIPVETFFVFHYLRVYKLTTRLLAGVVIFIVAGLAFSAFYANDAYHSQPTYSETVTPYNLTYISNVTPFSHSGPGQTYLFTVRVYDGNSTYYPVYNTSEVNVLGPNGYLKTIDFSQMNETAYANHSAQFTFTLSNLKSGVYDYNYSVVLNGTRVNMFSGNYFSGPINTGVPELFVDVIPTYTISYLVYFELIFAVGVFIGRSIGNSRRRLEPPKNQTPPQEQK